MIKDSRPGLLANYEIVRPGPVRLGPARIKKVGPSPARPAFGLARLTPLMYIENFEIVNNKWVWKRINMNILSSL